KWWLHGDPRPALRRAIANSARFVATPLVSKHRIFVWVPTQKIPENTVIVIARDDDTSLGILHSRFHEAWTLRLCTWLGVANDPAAKILKTRTLTNLYNERPTWLDNAHRDLDAAVAVAYGWPADISDEDALGRLLELNRSRAATQETRPIRVPRLGPQRTLL